MPTRRPVPARPVARLVRGVAACVLAAAVLGPTRAAAQDPLDAEAVTPPAKSTPFGSLKLMSFGRLDSVVGVAREQVGLRYRLGAQQPGKAFDCSGLVRHVLGFFGISLPRTAREQAQRGIEVPRDTSLMRPGDLLTFGKGRKVTHIGIYVGEGRYVHAANRRKGVIESRVPDPRTRTGRWWKGVRRVVPEQAPRAGTISVDSAAILLSGYTEVTE